MKFVDQLFGYKHFGLILIGIIIVLMIVFFVVLFLGKRDKKARDIKATKELEPVSTDAFKEEVPKVITELKVESPKLEEPNLGVPEPVNIIPLETPVSETLNSPTGPELSANPIPSVHPISQTPIEPVIPSIPEPSVEPEAKFNQISSIPKVTSDSGNVLPSDDIFKLPTYGPFPTAAPEAIPNSPKPGNPIPIVSEPVLEPTPVVPLKVTSETKSDSVSVEVNQVKSEFQELADSISQELAEIKPIEPEVKPIEPEVKPIEPSSAPKPVFSSVFVEPVKSVSSIPEFKEIESSELPSVAPEFKAPKPQEFKEITPATASIPEFKEIEPSEEPKPKPQVGDLNFTKPKFDLNQYRNLPRRHDDNSPSINNLN